MINQKYIKKNRNINKSKLVRLHNNIISIGINTKNASNSKRCEIGVDINEFRKREREKVY